MSTPPAAPANTPSWRAGRRRWRKLALGALLLALVWVGWGPVAVSRDPLNNARSLDFRLFGKRFRSFIPGGATEWTLVPPGAPVPPDRSLQLTFGGAGWLTIERSQVCIEMENDAGALMGTRKAGGAGAGDPTEKVRMQRRKRTWMVDNVALAITIAVFSGLLAGWAMVVRRWLFGGRKPGHCTTCGYRILPGQKECPECGAIEPCAEVGFGATPPGSAAANGSAPAAGR